jgi:hypothetical protein
MTAFNHLDGFSPITTTLFVEVVKIIQVVFKNNIPVSKILFYINNFMEVMNFYL